MSLISSIKISLLIFMLLAPSSAIKPSTENVNLRKQDTFLESNASFKNHLNSKPSTSVKHVVVATLETAPFMMKRQKVQDNLTSIEWYGYCMDLFNELIKHLPYEVTYEIYQVDDNKFGKRVTYETNKTTGDKPLHKKLERWNGLIGDLQQGKAHIALAPLAVMAERELAVDFTVPFYDLVGIQILLKKPEVPQDWFKFLTVLDGEVWFSITIAYFVTSFVIFLFDRLSPYSHKNLTRIRKLKRDRKSELIGNADSWIRTHKNNVNIPSHSYPTTLFGDGNQSDNQLKPSGEHLVKSHQLFVGSLSHAVIENSQRSTFLATGLESVLDKRKRSSIYPLENDNFRSDIWQSNRRGSKTMSDYFRSVNLRNGGVTWNSEDASSEEFDDDKPDFGLRDSLWFCITSLTPQGGGEAPQNLSGRVVAGAWWLFCFIIIASYTANLAAFLTVSRLDIPIENLDDLVKQYRIKYAPVDGTAEQTYFERMAYIEEIFYNIWKDMSLNSSLSEEERSKFAVWDYPISDKYTKIWTQIQQVGMPPDIESGIKRVKSSNLDDGFALLADANLVKHAVMTDCSLKSVGDEFSRKPIALGVQKGDEQFRDDLSYAILKLINQRYMEILREKWWTNNPSRVVCDNNDESEGISIENIGGVFIIIFVGVAVSFLVWAVERFIYKTKIGVSQELIQKI